MSATLDAGAGRGVSRRLPGRSTSPGRPHPLDDRLHAGLAVAGRRRSVACANARVRCSAFLPGAGEIAARPRRSRGSIDGAPIEVVPLHGSLDRPTSRIARVAAASRRRVILATNIAETSLTVPGVYARSSTPGCTRSRATIRIAGIDSLEPERISARLGRSARRPRRRVSGRGVVWRLWNAGRPAASARREPEIHRVDLSGAVLDVLAWGGDPRTFEWFDRRRRDCARRRDSSCSSGSARSTAARVTDARHAHAATAAPPAARAHPDRLPAAPRGGAGVRAAVGAPLRARREPRRRPAICCRRSRRSRDGAAAVTCDVARSPAGSWRRLG